jgi:hypothetical protein
VSRRGLCRMGCGSGSSRFPRFERRFRYPGRKPLDERQVLSGILFVLNRGSPMSISRKSSGSAQG